MARRSAFSLFIPTFWALTDQASFALSMLLIQVFLARALDVTEFGAFSTIFPLYTLSITLHEAFFAEPMMVFAAAKLRRRLPRYLGVLTLGHLFFASLTSLLFLVAAAITFLFHHPALAAASLGYAIATPFLLYNWFLRRACYVTRQPSLAAITGTVYLILITGGLFALQRTGHLSILSALLLLACAAAFVSITLFQKLNVRLHSIHHDRRLIGRVMTRHWRYGKWAALARPLVWLPGNFVYFVLPFRFSLDYNAALRALNIIILPIGNFNTAMSLLLLPSLARARARSIPRFHRITLIATVAFLILPLVFFFVLLFLAHPILNLLYGGGYTEHAYLAPYLALVPVLSSASLVLASALRALEQPRLIFNAYLFTSIITLCIGFPATWFFALPGAVFTMIIASATTTVALAILYRPHRPKPISLIGPG